MLVFNDNVLTYNDKWIGYDPYNPLNLPPYTIRLLYKDGVTPIFDKGTAIQVSQSPNIWDLTYENQDWIDLLRVHEDLLEVLGANSTGVTNMVGMFYGCYSLQTVQLFDTSNVTDMGSMFACCPLMTSIPLFDTSNVTNMECMFARCPLMTSIPLFDTSNVTYMQEMFDECNSLTTVPLFNTSNVTYMQDMFCNCTSLTTVPLFDTSNVTNMESMFYGCTNVESGALALYQQASTQSNPPTNHPYTFHYCGYNTPTGRAELAQIPSNWK